ncbi:unnamed protein product [Caretta caretta]
MWHCWHKSGKGGICQSKPNHRDKMIDRRKAPAGRIPARKRGAGNTAAPGEYTRSRAFSLHLRFSPITPGTHLGGSACLARDEVDLKTTHADDPRNAQYFSLKWCTPTNGGPQACGSGPESAPGREPIGSSPALQRLQPGD